MQASPCWEGEGVVWGIVNLSTLRLGRQFAPPFHPADQLATQLKSWSVFGTDITPRMQQLVDLITIFLSSFCYGCKKQTYGEFLTLVKRSIIRNHVVNDIACCIVDMRAAGFEPWKDMVGNGYFNLTYYIQCFHYFSHQRIPIIVEIRFLMQNIQFSWMRPVLSCCLRSMYMWL